MMKRKAFLFVNLTDTLSIALRQGGLNTAALILIVYDTNTYDAGSKNTAVNHDHDHDRSKNKKHFSRL